MIKDVKQVMNELLDALDAKGSSDAGKYYHDNCTVFFIEGSFYGKKQISEVLSSSFNIVKNTTFYVDKNCVKWNITAEDFASCTCEYKWGGTVQGKSFLSTGRATFLWVREGENWFVMNEHLSYMPK